MTPSTAAVRLLAGDKEPVRLATTANITLSGLQTIDGVLLVAGDRVLVKDQANATQNGIYTASEGTWRRAPDAASSRVLVAGMKVAVQAGTSHGGEIWSLTTNKPDIGDDDIEWEYFISANLVAEMNQVANDIIATVYALTGAADYASRAVAAAASLPSAMTYLRTAGYLTVGDGGGALYKKVVSQPSHNGKFQSADGAWWEIVYLGQPVNLLQFGARGDGTTDDRAAIQSAIDVAAAAGGGTVSGVEGKTYRSVINSGVTDFGLIVKSGVTLDLNKSTLNLECTGSVYGVRLQSNAHIRNGTAATTVSSSPGSQVIWHAPISIGAAYGEVTSVGALGNYINAERWSIRNMKVQNVRSGGGKIVGMGGIRFGVIEDIEFPSDTTSVGCVNFDWGTVGSINSADVPASRTAFNASTAYTVHPNNIDVRRLKIGAMTYATSNPIRLSGVHSIRISDFEIAQSNAYGVFHTAGDLGYEFAPSDVKRQRHRGIIIRNGSILAASTGVAVYCDAHADNVALAIAGGYSPLLDATQTSDILFENIRSIGNIASTAGTGIQIRYIDGGTIRNCFILGHQRGVLVAEAAKRVRIEGGEFTTCYQEGIYIGAGTAPEEITVDGAWCYSNGTGGAYGGIYAQSGIKHTITRCRLGGVSESFQDYGIVVDAACGDVEVSFNHCQGHAGGGAAYLMGTATSYGCLRLFTGNTVNTLYVTTVFSGLTIVPIEFTYSINGRMRRHLAQRVSLSSGITPTAGTWSVGDVIDYSDPLATGYRGVICTTAGSPGTWNRYGVSV